MSFEKIFRGWKQDMPMKKQLNVALCTSQSMAEI